MVPTSTRIDLKTTWIFATFEVDFGLKIKVDFIESTRFHALKTPLQIADFFFTVQTRNKFVIVRTHFKMSGKIVVCQFLKYS